jgi:hypothetical protein
MSQQVPSTITIEQYEDILFWNLRILRAKKNSLQVSRKEKSEHKQRIQNWNIFELYKYTVGEQMKQSLTDPSCMYNPNNQTNPRAE